MILSKSKLEGPNRLIIDLILLKIWIIVNNSFIRWYDGKSSVKDRRERDKWQLWREVSNKEVKEVEEHQEIFR
ncbi:hypothetical protein RhiirC2_799748 [Rhizophagus irregularis]|uniref:Uncharacterized protein n=1 Tax=Rhizophagus irregularis TaxID=588596 RepID=A0A2N1M4L3_9GLOM|nr:hypothetical protein RhiirC2_799748 [Rhizophagus irregularis]